MINDIMNKIFNAFFITGMLISAGLRYVSESVFLNIKFITKLDVSRINLILIVFSILSILSYYFILKSFDNKDYSLDLKAGYIIATLIIILTLFLIK